MSITIQLASAVAAELAQATLTEPFDAVMAVLPVYKLEDLDGVKVTVRPADIEITGATRSYGQWDIAVEICVQQRIGSDMDRNTRVVELAALIEEIADHLRCKKLASAEFATWLNCTIAPLYDPGHLQDHNVFTGRLEVSYRIMTNGK